MRAFSYKSIGVPLRLNIGFSSGDSDSDEAEERANKCTNELNIVKMSLQDNRAASVTKRLDMLQKENINLLETVEALKQELEAEKLKCNTQKV
ncbi:hypothetical protein Tco_1464986 [Tanacetum coccineum]